MTSNRYPRQKHRCILVVRAQQSCKTCLMHNAGKLHNTVSHTSGDREPLHLARLDITAPSHMTGWHPQAAMHACHINFRRHGCRENYRDNLPHECMACEGIAPSTLCHRNLVTWYCQGQTCSIPTAAGKTHMGHLYL